MFLVTYWMTDNTNIPSRNNAWKTVKVKRTFTNTFLKVLNMLSTDTKVDRLHGWFSGHLSFKFKEILDFLKRNFPNFLIQKGLSKIENKQKPFKTSYGSNIITFQLNFSKELSLFFTFYWKFNPLGPHYLLCRCQYWPTFEQE